MTELLVVVLGLGAPGFLPALAVAGLSPVLVFLAPLVGAGLAALAAELELGVDGSLMTWYVVVAVVANVGVAAGWWLARERWAPRADTAGGLSLVTVLVVLAALAIPLTALRGPFIGWDANSIWLTHALMVSGGHYKLVTGLKNPAYAFSNPDYPPLVPAVGALAFALFGRNDLHIVAGTTVLLNACVLGMVGTGIAAAGVGRRQLTQLGALAAGAAACLVGFALSGQYGVDGYTDLLWAAAAVAAVIWGLVLPPGTRTLVMAWICVAVASLTKNEGLTTGLALLVLIVLRYRPLTLSRARRRGMHPDSTGFPGLAVWPAARRRWSERAGFVVGPALPGLAWAGLIQLTGISDNFFKSPPDQSLLTRAQATIGGMAAHLTVAPVAAAVLVAGCCLLRRERSRVHFGNPAWLWMAWFASLLTIFATYVFGGYEIQGWLANSVNRTTIFAQLLLYADLAIWLIIALDAAFAPERTGQSNPIPAATDVLAGTPALSPPSSPRTPHGAI